MSMVELMDPVVLYRVARNLPELKGVEHVDDVYSRVLASSELSEKVVKLWNREFDKAVETLCKEGPAKAFKILCEYLPVECEVLVDEVLFASLSCEGRNGRGRSVVKSVGEVAIHFKSGLVIRVTRDGNYTILSSAENLKR